MKLRSVTKILEASPASGCAGTEWAEREVDSCHASDLISDLLACEGSGSLLLTGLTNAQVVRTAEILDFVAICLVRGKQPQPDTVQSAQQKGIPLFVSPLTMYECCGRLYARSLPAGSRAETVTECQA